MPWLHQEIARRMGERLSLIRLKPELLLDWWGGLGASAEVLESVYPNTRRIVVEPDQAWFERSSARCRQPWWSPRRWSAKEDLVLLETDNLPSGSELIWSNMMLHAVADPAAQIQRWSRLLKPDGFLMFSCLGPGTLRTLRHLYRRAFSTEPTLDFVDMHDLGDMLLAEGFVDPVMDQEELTLTWESPRQLMDELRGMGGNVHPARLRGLRTPRWYEGLLTALGSLRGSDGRLQLHFEVSYGHAFKGQPRVKVQSETFVSVDELRAMVKAPSRK